MSDAINIRNLAVGTRVVLTTGAEAEIVSNPQDGIWLFVRYISSADHPEVDGKEEMIFAQDVLKIQP
jgi:hypothetical protein